MDQKVDLKQYELFIDGKHAAPSTGEYTIDLDPATKSRLQWLLKAARPTSTRPSRRRAQH